MRFEEMRRTLRDGRICTLCSPETKDAADLIAFMRQSSEETPYLLRTPGEGTETEADEAEFLLRQLSSPRSCLIGAWVGGALAGSCGLQPIGERKKVRHRASLGIAVLRDFWSLGIGGLLLDQAIRTAAELGFEQLELDVFSGNGRAQRLYRSRGFRECGRIPNAYRLSETHSEESVQMVLPLPGRANI